MKEKVINDNNKEVVNNSEIKKDKLVKEVQRDEFEEVISISTGKVKRMRFAKNFGFMNNN